MQLPITSLLDELESIVDNMRVINDEQIKFDWETDGLTVYSINKKFTITITLKNLEES